MPNLIILRLTPATPTSGSNFTNYLNNLDIKAFDLSFGDPKIGVQIGQASGAWTPPSTNPLDPGLHDFSPATPKIFQHFSIVTINPIGPIQIVELEAVATAVIVVNPPPGHTEYQTPDLRLEITNNGRSILDQNLDFNVSVVADPVSLDPSAYIALGASVFFALPDPSLGLDPNVAFVSLPTDGTAPSFESVRDAVNLVLKADPTGGNSLLDTLNPLSAAQARQVARDHLESQAQTPRLCHRGRSRKSWSTGGSTTPRCARRGTSWAGWPVASRRNRGARSLGPSSSTRPSRTSPRSWMRHGRRAMPG